MRFGMMGVMTAAQQVRMVASGSVVLGLGYIRRPLTTATMVVTTTLWFRFE
jgi:hypothetical protein